MYSNNIRLGAGGFKYRPLKVVQDFFHQEHVRMHVCTYVPMYRCTDVPMYVAHVLHVLNALPV